MNRVKTEPRKEHKHEYECLRQEANLYYHNNCCVHMTTLHSGVVHVCKRCEAAIKPAMKSIWIQRPWENLKMLVHARMHTKRHWEGTRGCLKKMRRGPEDISKAMRADLPRSGKQYPTQSWMLIHSRGNNWAASAVLTWAFPFTQASVVWLIWLYFAAVCMQPSAARHI